MTTVVVRAGEEFDVDVLVDTNPQEVRLHPHVDTEATGDTVEVVVTDLARLDPGGEVTAHDVSFPSLVGRPPKPADPPERGPGRFDGRPMPEISGTEILNSGSPGDGITIGYSATTRAVGSFVEYFDVAAHNRAGFFTG